MAIGTISSAGVGSNLNIADIVSKLMEIERAPLNRLSEKKTSYQAKISALATIKSSLSTLQSALSGLKSGSTFGANTITSSNTAVVSATSTGGAATGSYSIEVSDLAYSQKLVATGQADTTSAIGSGASTTLTIDLGTISGGTFNSVTGTYSGASFTSNGSGPYTVTIDSTNNSLGGIRDAINDANIGVTATIVNDGSATNPYRLVLSSTSSGADQSMSIAVSGDATLSSLLSQDPTGTQNLSEKVTAQNASFTVDGISITKTSNTVTDVIDGVTLNLLGETAGTPVTLSVSQDTAAITDAVQTFVDAYNDLNKQIRALTDSGASGGTAGALASDSLTRQMLSSIRDELTQTVTGITGSYTSLSNIGVAFQQDGTLALDSSTLTTALQTDSTNVADVFSSADGVATRLDSVLTDMLAYNGTIATRTEGYNDRIDSLDDQSVTLEGRLARIEQRLRAQFTNLDVLIGQMSVTSNYLTQQIASLNNLSSK